MGRILVLLGVVLVIGGTIGTTLGAFAGVGSIFSGFSPDTFMPDEDKLCREGETLVEETGPSERIPGGGFASSVLVFCVDADGTRREVTGDFVNDTMGGVFSMLDGILPGIGGTVLLSLLIPVGVVLIVVGALIGRRRNTHYVQVGTPAQYTSGTSLFEPDPRRGSARGTAETAGATVAERLKQLDDLRNRDLINADEYDRLRQKILDEM
jgi:hypothetical protein